MIFGRSGWVLLFAVGLGLCQGQDISPEVQTLYQAAQRAQANNDNETAVADYRKIIRLAPALAPAYNNLGRLLFNLNRFPEAAEVLKKGLVINPEMHPAQVVLGASYLQMGQFSQALAPLQAGVEAMPDDRFARMSLVRTLLGLGKPDDALNQLNTLLASDPKDQESWYLLGKLHLQLSENAFSQVQTLGPDTALAHVMEGEVMESMQNTPGAVAAYKHAVEKAPEESGPLEHLADVYWHTGDWSHAEEQLAKLVTREPGNCRARWKLANSIDEQGDPAGKALLELDTALKQCPELTTGRAERAKLLIRSGHAKEALPDLEAAEKIAPDEPTVQQLYAQAYKALGDKPRADAANKRFLELQTAIHQARENHTRMVMQANQ